MDVFGTAIKEFYNTEDDTLVISVSSELAGEEEIPVDYLFRELEDMPNIERKALKMAKGKVLDVGACAGAHSLVLQERGFNITALEKSEAACDVLELRGVKNVIQNDFFEFKNHKYDTLLMLMNGIGIAGRLENLHKFLLHAKSLLKPEGAILLDSSDIIYMYQEEDGSYLIDIAGDYYGNMNYNINYNQQQENFDWLYISFDLLQDSCNMCGLVAKKILDGEHYDYLVEITIASKQ